MKFAVIGSGISGLSIATILSQDHEVALYEKEDRFGGHSNTVEINYKDEIINVDTGFIVFNKRTKAESEPHRIKNYPRGCLG